MTTIYLVRNVVNNKFYIGKTTRGWQNRWKEHREDARLNSKKVLCQAIRKYGPDKFSVGPLAEVPDDVANYMEKYYIRAFSSNERNFGYNLTLGGDGCSGPCSVETRKKISESLRGHQGWSRGRKASLETRQKLSTAAKKRKGFVGYFRGKKLSLEHRQKISLSRFIKTVAWG